MKPLWKRGYSPYQLVSRISSINSMSPIISQPAFLFETLTNPGGWLHIFKVGQTFRALLGGNGNGGNFWMGGWHSLQFIWDGICIHSLKLIVRTWKMDRTGIRSFPFLFSQGFAVSFRDCTSFFWPKTFGFAKGVHSFTFPEGICWECSWCLNLVEGECAFNDILHQLSLRDFVYY